jgi:hypothetical protein
MAVTDVLVEIVLDVDLDKEPECESPSHEIEFWWHGGPATHIVRGPCSHVWGLRCAAYVSAVRQLGLHCQDCGADYEADEIRFIEA